MYLTDQFWLITFLSLSLSLLPVIICFSTLKYCQLEKCDASKWLCLLFK